MTFDQFLRRLRKLQGHFHVRAWGLFPGELRTPDGACPVSAVANLVKYGPGVTIWNTQVTAPAEAIGLPKLLAWDIARAADRPSSALRPVPRNYRNRMLRALKIREV